jgi:hypothetical protein
MVMKACWECYGQGGVKEERCDNGGREVHLNEGK